MKYKETEQVELKKSLAHLDSSIRTICAFLNHEGGSIYFGIDNDGKVVGQPATDNNLKKISQKIRSRIKPEILPKIEEKNICSKPVIKITVEKKEHTLFYCDGVVYTRCGTETVKMPPGEIEDRILKRKRVNWEKQICRNANFDDLNIDTIKRFIELAKDNNRLSINNEKIELILKKLELLQDGRLTNAAILVFGKEPFQFFPNTTIKCGRFKNKKKEEFIDMKDYNSNLFENLENVMMFLKNHLRIGAKIKGLLREEKWEIPLDALRESVLNAIIHRDYYANSFVYIKFYDDSIVIANPGILPRELSIEDLYKEHESKLRNPIVGNVFYMAGFVDVWGRGILNILDLMKKEGLDYPRFEESADSFRIIFHRQVTPQVGKNVGKEERREIILDMIKNKAGFTHKSLADKLNVNEKTIERDLKKLKEDNKIKFIGSKRKGCWKIIDDEKE